MPVLRTSFAVLSLLLAGAVAPVWAAANPDALDAEETTRVSVPDIGVPRSDPQPWRERLAGLSPEQRQQMREQIREQWQNRPPEDRQRMREEFRDQREFRREDRQRLREDVREHSGSGGGGVFFRRGGGRF
jgi:hypothetical protein